MALAWYHKLRGKWLDAFNNVHEHHEVFLKQLKQFSLQELQTATDDFSRRNVLTRCGFGKFYRGTLRDGIVVAVKRLVGECSQGREEFQNEIEVSNMASHRNLLHIHGFCMTKTERFLVYSYMENGSLTSCLRENQPPLDWPIRKRIAQGTAKGLAYLHNHCAAKIIHLDIKSENILLGEHFEPVIGGFELATIMDHKVTHVTSVVRGTIGHIAPEFLSIGELSEKTDVFGYGMTLLELITGQRVFDMERRLANDDYVMLLDWVKGLLEDRNIEAIADANMQGNYPENEVEQMIQVALICTQSSPLQRPNMSDVVYLLEGHGLAEKWLPVEEPWTDLYFNNPRATTSTI